MVARGTRKGAVSVSRFHNSGCAYRTQYAYDLRNRVTNIQTLGLQSYAFTLDAAGNRTRIDELDVTAMVYGYDELGRL